MDKSEEQFYINVPSCGFRTKAREGGGGEQNCARSANKNHSLTKKCKKKIKK